LESAQLERWAMNFLQAQPPAQIKVDGVVCDYLRQKVLSKMFKFVNGKGIDGMV
jgi:hypothetical protein